MRCFLNVALLCRDDKDSYINTQDWYSLFNDILMSIIDIVNQNLGTEIHIDDFTLIDENDEEALYELWHEVVNKSENVFYMGSGKFEYSVSLEDESEENIDEELESYQEPQPDSKASAAILKFFDSNSNALIAKLKDSGLQLSASALQNDQNITRVANVVYNLLPGMVRIFVSFDTVENFLLEHRQWLINKLI